MDIDEAVAFHAKFRIRLRAFIGSPEESVPETIRRDDLCPLGQWLYGPEGQKLANHAPYTNLLQCHKALHNAATLVASKAVAGDKKAALEMMEPGSDFAQRSKAILQAIADLKHSMAK